LGDEPEIHQKSQLLKKGKDGNGWQRTDSAEARKNWVIRQTGKPNHTTRSNRKDKNAKDFPLTFQPSNISLMSSRGRRFVFPENRHGEKELKNQKKYIKRRHQHKREKSEVEPIQTTPVNPPDRTVASKKETEKKEPSAPLCI